MPSPSPSLHRRTVYVSALDRFLFFLQFAVISSLLIEKGVNITSGRLTRSVGIFFFPLLFPSSLSLTLVPRPATTTTYGFQ